MTEPILLPGEKVLSNQKHQEEETQSIETEEVRVGFSNIGANIVNIFLKKYDQTLPVTKILQEDRLSQAAFRVISQTDKEILFEFDDNGSKIFKKFEFIDDFSLIAEISGSSNPSEHTTLFNLDMTEIQEPTKRDMNAERSRSLFEYMINTSEKIIRKNKAFKFNNKDQRLGIENADWLGFRTRYFCFVVNPLFDGAQYDINPESSFVLNFKEKFSSGSSRKYHLFFGPENNNILKKYEYNYDKIKRYYKLGIFDITAKVIYSILNLINKFVPNWGVCIILISIIVYFSMYPLTQKGLKSMKKMQALQPQLATIREKYKDNPQKLNQEMMELYKKHQINPLGGCLPMILQMPVFIGLYQVLYRSVSLKGSSFLWIKDLSMPDRLFMLPTQLPVIGNEINVLPLVILILMFFQQRFSMKNMSTSDPAQAQQQKIMSIFFPIFLGFIFYRLSSGLTLYFSMFYMFSTFSQFQMSKQVKVE